MNGEMWAAIGGALLTALATLLAALIALPKVRAQARLTNAEADESITNRLYREIARLDAEMKEVRAELVKVREAATDEKAALERENKILRTLVGRLRRRIEGLEKILKVEVKITPEMQRLIDELAGEDASEREAP